MIEASDLSRLIAGKALQLNTQKHVQACFPVASTTGTEQFYRRQCKQTESCRRVEAESGGIELGSSR